jgi:hypothetical protein
MAYVSKYEGLYADVPGVKVSITTRITKTAPSRSHRKSVPNKNEQVRTITGKAMNTEPPCQLSFRPALVFLLCMATALRKCRL